MLFPSFFLFALLAIEAKAVTVLANFVRTGSNLLQTAPYLYLRVERAHSSEITVKEHIILGIDERDAECNGTCGCQKIPPSRFYECISQRANRNG
jgi:hypothetical protein